MTSRKKRRISWQFTLTMAVLCFLLGLAGVLCLLTSAMGGTHDAFSLSDTAVPIRDVNGLSRDGEGNYYIGCGGSSSIQVFDREERFFAVSVSRPIRLEAPAFPGSWKGIPCVSIPTGAPPA